MQHKPIHCCPITASVPVVSSRQSRAAARCAAGRYALLPLLAVLVVSGQARPIEILPRPGDGLRDVTTQPDVPTQPGNLVRLILINESGVEVFVEHDAQKLYCTFNPSQGSVDSIHRANFDGSNVETLIPDAVSP